MGMAHSCHFDPMRLLKHEDGHKFVHFRVRPAWATECDPVQNKAEEMAQQVDMLARESLTSKALSLELWWQHW